MIQRRLLANPNIRLMATVIQEYLLGNHYTLSTVQAIVILSTPQQLEVKTLVFTRSTIY